MALALTCGLLVALTVPMLGLLAVSGLEPLIARNLVDGARALYAAEAGIEWAFALLADTAGAEMLPGVPTEPAGAEAPTSPGAEVNLVPPPGLLPWGAASITARASPGAVSDGASGTPLSLVVLTSTGTVNGAQRSLEVTVARPMSSTGGAASQGGLGQTRLVNWRER
jgi:hypothetical protein